MMEPIENVASFSMMAIYIVAIAGAIILTLLMTLAIRERMYETGVLLSMGEGKVKVIAQYVTEVLLIAILAFGLSVFTGQFVAQNIGDKLVQREVKVAQEQGVNGNNQGGQFGRLMQQRFRSGANGNIQPIESINVQVSSSEVGKMVGAGLLIIILGTILPASSIMRYKPKTILTKAA
jgi:putative ABC transport system permease protein